MTSIYLCDDNEVLLSRYKQQITELALKHSVEYCITTFTSGEQLLFHLCENPNDADIIYLDIIMGKMNGLDVAKKLRETGFFGEIIFLTSSEEYVFDSFDANPLYYILKESPHEKSKLEESFLRGVSLTSKKATEFFICANRMEKKQIPLHLISYFEIHSRVVTVHYDGQKVFEFYSSMDSLLSQLNQHSFIRCHRSYVIGLKYIDTLDAKDVLLTTGKKIPIGTTYMKDLKLAFSKSLCEIF